MRAPPSPIWRSSSAAPSSKQPPDRRRDGSVPFKQEAGAPLGALNRVVLLCYYRDDRVMRSLGQEPRSPFSKGHVVEQGDWSLLDPVRKRAPMWRRAT